MMPTLESDQTLKLLYDGAALLEDLTGWHVEAKPTDALESPKGDAFYIVRGGKAFTITVECKGQLTLSALMRTIEWIKINNQQSDRLTLLLAPYIPPTHTRELRQNKVSHMDLTGTVYLNLPDLLVWFGRPVRGSGQTKSIHEFKRTRNVLTITNTKLVYVLLTDPARATWPYRQLAELAGISLGAVKSAMDTLQQQLFIRHISMTKRKLILYRALLERWWRDYEEGYRLKIIIGRYRTIKPTHVQTLASDLQNNLDADFIPLKLSPEHASFGGEYAATALLGDLKPSAGATIYLHDRKSLNRILAENRLSRDPEGNVEILAAFWPRADELQPGIVPPLVAYADLCQSASSRCWEAAQAIYERYLKEYTEHDS